MLHFLTCVMVLMLHYESFFILSFNYRAQKFFRRNTEGIFHQIKRLKIFKSVPFVFVEVCLWHCRVSYDMVLHFSVVGDFPKMSFQFSILEMCWMSRFCSC